GKRLITGERRNGERTDSSRGCPKSDGCPGQVDVGEHGSEPDHACRCGAVRARDGKDAIGNIAADRREQSVRAERGEERGVLGIDQVETQQATRGRRLGQARPRRRERGTACVLEDREWSDGGCAVDDGRTAAVPVDFSPASGQRPRVVAVVRVAQRRPEVVDGVRDRRHVGATIGEHGERRSGGGPRESGDEQRNDQERTGLSRGHGRILLLPSGEGMAREPTSARGDGSYKSRAPPTTNNRLCGEKNDGGVENLFSGFFPPPSSWIRGLSAACRCDDGMSVFATRIAERSFSP